MRKLILRTLLVGTLIFAAYSWWYMQQMKADPIAKKALVSSDSVEVKLESASISFVPNGYANKLLVFYPGAFVDPVAYAPLCHELARHGIECIIVEMPLRSALFDYEAAGRMGISQKLAKEYILAGHSHGAEMAAHFIHEHPGRFHKLILIGTQYPEKISLTDTAIRVMKVYGTHDGLEPVSEVEKNKTKLPSTTKYLEISGANHGQFGYYGDQPFDNAATITREEQQKQLVQAMLTFISN